MGEKLVLLDGYSLMYRAFHALSTPMTAPDGTPTNAVHGFVMMLLRVLDEEAPTAAAVAFDVGKHTFRTDLYDGYKANRKPMPEELRQQDPVIRDLLARMGLRVIECEGFEADDILGTLSRQCEERGVEALLVTGDRDSFQLAGDNTTILYTKRGIAETQRVTPAWVEETYGVSPAQLIDVKGLMGDTSDNIPGVPGVGEKTALRLIAQYGDLEHVLAGADAGEKGRLRERLLENADLARLSRTLATIRRDVPVSLDLEHWRLSGLGGGLARLRELGMNQAQRRLAQMAKEPASAPAPAAPRALPAAQTARWRRRKTRGPRRAPRGAGRHGEARRRLYWNGIFRRHGRGAPAHAAGRRSHRSRHWRGGGARSGAAAACLRSAQGALQRQGAGRSAARDRGRRLRHHARRLCARSAAPLVRSAGALRGGGRSLGRGLPRGLAVAAAPLAGGKAGGG